MNETIKNLQKNTSIKNIIKFIISITIIIFALFINPNNSICYANNTYNNQEVFNKKSTNINNDLLQTSYEDFTCERVSYLDDTLSIDYKSESYLDSDLNLRLSFYNLIHNAIKKQFIENSYIVYSIANNGLNLRDLNMEVIKTLPLNSEILVLQKESFKDSNYSLILHNDQYAYINNKYLNSQKKILPKVENKIAQQNEIVQANIKGSDNTLIYLGTFISTAYCECSKCCGKWADGKTASGTTATAGRTIAVDPSVIPLGSIVIINGKSYIAEDTGSAIKGKKIDIYYDSHSAANQWGRRTVEVYLVK